MFPSAPETFGLIGQTLNLENWKDNGVEVRSVSRYNNR